ncbi:hypothetical protein CEE37_13755 [candidate division LCP-89 bacterium B3_LCP]|uniref:Uncharacterized protein n=1 Tax=candidate division LCP-89 bacterium B3_LCP TaxID=2012998 RepID=A0A532URJ5_UNCL8|nr:MAG: hypothetical protein CEE37_13755 [candidate division LCP-89 bacterium B3_LCP]
MSILLVEVVSGGIIFGADRNITVKNGTEPPTQRTKVLKWPNENTLFGFVGATAIDNMPINEWLETIRDEFNRYSELHKIAKNLAKKIQPLREEMEGNYPARPLIVHLGGFIREHNHWKPSIWHISNAHKMGRYRYLSIKKQFGCNDAFKNKFSNEDVSEIRDILRIKEKNFDPLWFHQGIDLFTFNVLEESIRSAFKSLCEQHPNHDIPKTIEEWAKYVKMKILMYSAYYQAFKPANERSVGGEPDVEFLQWPEE